MLMRRALGPPTIASAWRVAGRRAFWTTRRASADVQNADGALAPREPGHLDGKIAWVIGGAGVIGTGLAHGLLRAGATVIVNSRYKARLQALVEELGHPEKLVTYQGSMLAEGAEATTHGVMELTAGQLDHVVTHSAVRWWGAHNDGDETNTLQNIGSRGSLLHLSVDDFSQSAVALPQMQVGYGCRADTRRPSS